MRRRRRHSALSARQESADPDCTKTMPRSAEHTDAEAPPRNQMLRSRAPFERRGTERNRVLFTLAARFGWVCWYCNRKLDQCSASVDHIIPRACGGLDSTDNLALACEFCQRAKWDLPLHQFLEWLDFLRQGDSVTWLREFIEPRAFDRHEIPENATCNQ